MSYNEQLADRIRQLLQSKKIQSTEKKMFGGVCFMVDDKMLIGVEKERLMARIDPEDEPKALKKKGAKPMDFTGRIMKGFLFIDDKAVDLDKDLEYWVDLCMKYNPKAKSSKKKQGAGGREHGEKQAKKKSDARPKAKAKAKAKE